MKKTKTAWLKSLLALVLCLSLLIGSTFAWFTSSVTTSGNIIKAGNLDIKMYWTDDLASGVWYDVEDAAYNTIFSYENWEPGYTDVKYIKLVNEGNLAFNYKLTLTPQAEVGKLAEVINVWFANEGVPMSSAADLSGLGAIGLLSNVLNGGVTADGTLLAAGQQSPLHPSGEVIMTVAMNMITSAGNEYQGETSGDFTVTALATQAPFESDSFGTNYDANATYPTVITGGNVTASVTPDNGKVPTGGVSMSGNGIAAFVPAGVALEDGANALTLSVTPLENTTSGITVVNKEVLIPVDVHVSGVAANNTVPIVIDLGEILPKHMNMGNYHLFHVENGQNAVMTLVGDKSELVAHNQFTYDPVTGAVSVAMATFSEVALVADTANAWEGGYDYKWYAADAEELEIANADQLAAFGAIVGGMAKDEQGNAIARDSFEGQTIKLLADINLGDAEKTNNPNILFYPIGYSNNTGSYNKTNDPGVTSTIESFEGTFDGNGHTIANFYQNTWEMFGDYNNGYPDNSNYYKDAMGLFGYVYGGTVKNLTVSNFSSDGEFTPTGVIAAYADGDATFENIAITDCNPRVYNTGNGGIVGIAGDTSAANDDHITLKNITVDNSNKISALWGSYDVACGGLVGMYRGNVDANGNATGDSISFENCHVAAKMDVYNDVCGNYQYYAYRYAGMIIGSVRHNTKNAEGKTIPNMEGISATGCTVNYGDWNDYYYCEFEENTMASYSEDYQFSRVPNSEIDTTNGKENATCIGHNHTVAEDKQAVYLPFHQLFTGYSWGVSSIGLKEYSGIVTDLGITEGDQKESVVKFETKFTGDFLYRVGNQNTVSIDSLFTALEGVKINNSGVWVTVEKTEETMNVSGTFTANTSDWTQGTLQFSGTGVVKVTIQDYNFCKPTELYLEVVEATNITSATAGTGKNFVLLQNVIYTDTYLYYKNSTLYGNGFTLDITGADHSDLKGTSDTNSNKSAYCNIWMVDSRFDNVQIKGSVYPEVGMTADSDYGNAAIRTEGECYITNSYISNCRVPLRVQGNTTLIDTVVDGGRYANIELRSGKLTLDGVTTINTVRKGTDGKTDVIGFGIVIHSEAANASIAVIGDGLKQYNWVGENAHKNILSGDSNLSSAYKLIFNANNSDTIYFDYNNDRYVNTGILCLCADMNKEVVTGLDDRSCQEVSGYDAWVLTYDNSKHTAWFNESVAIESVSGVSKQYPILPTYSGTASQTFEFTKGGTVFFDTAVLTAEKFGKTLEMSSVVMNGTTYNYGDKIAITEGGVYEIIYTVVDPYNYNADASSATTVNHTVSVTVTTIAKDAEILAPKFTFIDQNGNKYESTTVKTGDKTYIMPNVTAADPTTNSMSSINIGSASISGTTVYFPIATGYTVRSGSNFNRYYPLFNGINITDYTIAGDTTGTTYTTSGNYTSLVGSSGTKFIIPANSGQTNCGDYVKTDGQAGNAAGNSDSGWQGAGYSTSYGGTYLKSGNTNASSGADSNGYERIVWVEYCFNAGNGDVYYYRIGYHCNKESAQSCFTPDTLITLADGAQVRVDELKATDKILAWDFFTGSYVEQDVSILVNHGEDLYKVANLTFSDGAILKIIAEHGIFDYDLNRFVYITADNMHEYVGHRFVKYAADGSYTVVTLTDAYATEEYTSAWSVSSAITSNAFASGLLTVAPPEDFYNWIAMDGKLTYDAEQFQNDVATYGLYTYEDFADYVTYEQFVDWNGAYLKIAVEKGYFTFEYILELIELYKGWMV